MSKTIDKAQELYEEGRRLADGPVKSEQWKGVDMIHEAARLGNSAAQRYLDYHSNPDNNV